VRLAKKSVSRWSETSSLSRAETWSFSFRGIFPQANRIIGANVRMPIADRHARFGKYLLGNWHLPQLRALPERSASTQAPTPKRDPRVQMTQRVDPGAVNWFWVGPRSAPIETQVFTELRSKFSLLLPFGVRTLVRRLSTHKACRPTVVRHPLGAHRRRPCARNSTRHHTPLHSNGRDYDRPGTKTAIAASRTASRHDDPDTAGAVEVTPGPAPPFLHGTK
jgi:hypothetical protein